MGKVLKADASVAIAFVVGPPLAANDVWYSFGLALTTTALAKWATSGSGEEACLAEIIPVDDGDLADDLFISDPDLFGAFWFDIGSNTGNTPAPAAETWMDCELHYNSLSRFLEFYIDETPVWTSADVGGGSDIASFSLGICPATGVDIGPGGVVYFRDVRVGTTRGAADLFADDFSSADLSAWSSEIGDVSVVDDPLGPPPPPPPRGPGRRVGIAFDSGPLDVLTDDDWTWLDDETVFPASFVAGYDTKNGRQGLISQTETGTATVYINDNKLGLFDDRNTSSPYHGKLDGKQIILQLWDPVAAAWEKQFGGWIDDYHYDIDGSAVRNLWDAPEDRQPINASIQIECVDMFERLAGFGLTPGLAGVRPLSGMEDGVYYAEATVQGRIIEVLADVGIPAEMRGPEDNTGVGDISQGNVHTIAVKYDPDESALAALRDAADAEFPFIGNIYCDRRGRFQFHGRYARFAPGRGGDPDAPLGTSDEAGSHWDFHRWKVGDGAAIAADADRAQMRVLAFERSRGNLINAALCYPQDIAAADMRNQVYANAASIDAYGKHDAPPMSDLLTADDLLTSGMPNAKRECFKFAKLHVKNQKDPRESITALQVKAIRPTDPRAETTWAFMTRSDIGHIVNAAVGYPGGTGFTGSTPQDDYYIEGRTLRVRPLNPDHDYVEYDVNVSPAVWSMDTHGVFPPLFAPEPEDTSPPVAEFDVAETDTGTFVFTDNSVAGNSGPITDWAWDFGDGSGTSTDQNPEYTYSADGTYNVTLTVTGTGGDGTDDESRLLKVTGL